MRRTCADHGVRLVRYVSPRTGRYRYVCPTCHRDALGGNHTAHAGP